MAVKTGDPRGWAWIAAAAAAQSQWSTKHKEVWDGQFGGKCPGCSAEVLWDAFACEAICDCHP